MIPGTLFFDWFMFKYWTKAVLIVSFVAAHFNELGFSSILPPHSHVILHVGLALSCRIYISKSEGKPSPMGRVASQGGWGVMESALPRPSPSVCDGPPLPEGGGYLLDDGFCDFALGFAQNDRGWRYTAKSESFRMWETNQKGIWCYVYRFLMMPGTLFFDWLMCWVLNKSGSYRAVCRCIV